jgi:hypothetical protein
LEHRQAVKQNFAAVFQQLFQLRGRGFARLNQALLTLILKHAGASTLREYRPISLIHLVAKLFAKLLSLHLAPKIDNLVSPLQNAFIPKRSLHDNFVLAWQSARLLHQLGAPRILLKLFVLAVDTLGRLFRRATELGILRQLHPTKSIPNISLYADDDVVLFYHAQPDDIEAVKAILCLFGIISGLQVNYTKSAAMLICCDLEEAVPVVQMLWCPIVDMPITYLGIPLTVRCLTAA